MSRPRRSALHAPLALLALAAAATAARLPSARRLPLLEPSSASHWGARSSASHGAFLYQRPLDAMVDVTNQLAANILEDHAFSGGNFAFSPYGAASVLVVLYEGARGESARQIHSALRLPWDRDVTRVGFRDIHRHLRSYFTHEGYLSGMTLSKNQTALRPEFRRVLRFYGYDVDLGMGPSAPNSTATDAPTTADVPPTLISTTEGATPAETEQPTSEFPEVPTSTALPSTEGITEDSGDAEAPASLLVSTAAPSTDSEAPTTSVPDTTEPPTTSSPDTTEPPTTSSLDTTKPPTTSSPDTTEPPTTSSPDTTKPPTTSSPDTTEPPTTSSPDTTQPPSTSSPDTTEPPSTSSPDTPSTSPPDATEPPTTSPDTTKPPTTSSPDTTEPPSTSSPNTTEPPSTSSPNTTEPLSTSFPDTTEPPSTSSPETTKPPSNSSPTTSEAPSSSSTSSETTYTSSPSTSESSSSSSPAPTTSEVPSSLLGTSQESSSSSPATSEEQSTSPSTNETSSSSAASSEVPPPSPAASEASHSSSSSSSSSSSEVSSEDPSPEASAFSSETVSSDASSSSAAASNVTSSSSETTKEPSTEAAATEVPPSAASTKATSSTASGEEAPSTEGHSSSEVPASGAVAFRSFDDTSASPSSKVRRESTSTAAVAPGMRMAPAARLGAASPKRGRAAQAAKRRGPAARRSGQRRGARGGKGVKRSAGGRAGRKPQGGRARRRRAIYFGDSAAAPWSSAGLSLHNGWYDSRLTHGNVLYEQLPHLPFLVDGQAEEPVPVMTFATVFPYAYVPRLDAFALEFPLDDERYRLLLLLPHERHGLPHLMQALRFHSLRAVCEQLVPTRVHAVIPSFMVEGFVTLTGSLQQAGVWDVFDPRRANLGTMSEDPELYVRNIEQAITVVIRNYVEIFDIQTRTTAARSRAKLFVATHPFLFFVVDTETKISLIAGKIVDPLNSHIH